MPANANTMRREWPKLAAPALAILLVYSIVVMRPAHQRQQADNSKLHSLQTAVDGLKERKEKLTQLLSNASQEVSLNNGASPAIGSTFVSRSDGSPTQLCSLLLACVEKAGLHCVAVTDGSGSKEQLARGSKAGPEIRLELVGSFTQLSQLLEQLASELEQVSVHTLQMNNRGNNECTWQLELELRGGLI